MKVTFPTKLSPLFEPKRYKILHGGRGGAKSWGIARALLTIGAQKPLRILCAREFQNSIRDSVHKLLSDQIAALGLENFYTIQNAQIKGKNGTEFSFEGLRHNVNGIKSYEGVDIAWVEEAQTVSKSSWEILIPTVRKEDSEIWVSFNPELEEDETYRRFVKHPPHESIVIKLNWSDNPWFPEVLRLEKDELKARDPDAYLNIWEGQCRLMLDGAIYANELRAAMEEGRITRVPYDRSKPVHTAWDLGRADMTSIWFFQVAGLGELKAIDYYENNQHALGHYLEVLQGKGYVYGTDYMPHDAASEHLAATKSIAGQAREVGRTVRIIERSKVSIGINVARTLFPNIWIDEEKCADGIQCLRHYRYDVDPDTKQFSKEPLHDWASHGADAWRYMCLGFKEPKKVVKKAIVQPRQRSWMSA